MEGVISGRVSDQSQPQFQQAQDTANTVDRLSSVVQHQLNLESLKARATSLFKAISRILEGFDTLARTNSVPKWQDVLGQFSMVNLELFNIVEDVKKVSKAFVVHPTNINAQNPTILPIMLSTKLLPEMEMEDNSKREKLLHGMQNLAPSGQIEKLKARIDMISAACESAEKVLAETRKAYCFGGRQSAAVTAVVITDKAQAAKIHEQENLLRGVVNFGEGVRVSGDQKPSMQSLPMHLVGVLPLSDSVKVPVAAAAGAADAASSGFYMRNMTSMNGQSGGLVQQAPPNPQSIGRGASPAAALTGTMTSAAPLENTTAASPMHYANSPKSSTSMTNAASPSQQQQQQIHLQQQQLHLQHQLQRQKLLQLPQQQQILAQQQQFRQSPMQGLGQTLGGAQFQQQLSSSGVMGQVQQQQQLGAGGIPMSRHLGQLAGATNTNMLTAHMAHNSQMAAMSAQQMRMQYGNLQRTAAAAAAHPSHILTPDQGQLYGGMMVMQQQQQALPLYQQSANLLPPSAFQHQRPHLQ